MFSVKLIVLCQALSKFFKNEVVIVTLSVVVVFSF